MERINSFEDLKCWQACRTLRVFIAKDVVPQLPKEEQFRLKDQLLRCARSTTANIAEGFGRFHHLDNAKFCSSARDSNRELLDHPIAGHDEGLATEELLENGRMLISEANRILNGYIKYLRNAAKTAAK